MRPLPVLAALALAATFLVAALAVPRAPEEATSRPPGRPPGGLPPMPFGPWLEAPPEPVRFLAWGDSGHGNPSQYKVAEAARRVCERDGCDFVLLLGDNVYPSGVRSADDPQFRQKFEDPYRNLSLPFYAVLGNHDVELGKVEGAQRDNGDFQVAYDARSERWVMPARHYAFREGPVQVVALDATVAHPSGRNETRAAEQLAWLEGTWDGDATWRIAMGHFPYASLGSHGNATEGVARFLEAGVCGRADLYLAGHDHNLQWLAPAPGCPGTELVVSGASSEPKPLVEDASGALFARGGALGFFWFEADGERLTGRAYDAEGNVLFERVLTKDA